MKTAFLDTNVFLHYEPFDQINWLEIVQAESVTIIIPPVTIRELNKHKEYHSRPRVRNRAGEVLKRLHALFESTAGASLRDNVDIVFEDRDPTIDFATHQLSPDIQDDHLIASILMHQNEAPGTEIVLVTSDAGLALLVKARRHGVVAAGMPDNLRLAEQPDPSQKRTRQLEEVIRDLKSRIPRLSLTFEDGNQYATFALPAPLGSEPDELERRLNEIKQRYQRYPRRQEANQLAKSGQTARSQELSKLVAAAMGSMRLVSQEEITRYNTELEKFYDAYDNYLKNRIRFENLKRRTIELAILLANDGTAPAEDIHIFMHFPDGFRLLEGKNLPRPPHVPEPPVEPRTTMQVLAEPLSHMIQLPYVASRDSGPIAPPPNVSAPSIKRTGSYDVSLRVQKAKHNLQEPIKPLYVAFDSFEEACSFHIDYRILAANIPREIKGNLHVVIQKEGNES